MLNELLKLNDKGIKYLMAEYSGSGDEGSIDTWDYYTSSQIYGDNEFDIANDREVARTHLDNNEISNALEAFVYKLLEGVEDWYNNDGGYGVVIIDTKTGCYKIYNHVRYTESYEYNHEGKIEL